MRSPRLIEPPRRSDRRAAAVVFLTLVVAGLVAFLAASPHAAGRPTSGAVEVLALGDGPSLAGAMTAGGIVVGSSETADGWLHPFSWTEEHGIVALDKPAGTYDCNVNAVNERGESVGECVNAVEDGYRAFLWTKSGDVVPLESPDGAWGCSAKAITDSGRILGECYSDEHSNLAVVWTR